MDRRRRSMAGSPAADESTAGATVVCAADGADGGAEAGAEAGAAVVCAADGSDGGRAAEEREERLELAIVGQELVPVSDRRVSSLEEESLEKVQVHKKC